MESKNAHLGSDSSEYLQAAERVAAIYDLLVDILVRLPAKKLVRLKLVSKHWCSLISDTQFVQSHIRRNNFTPGMFYYRKGSINFFWLSGKKKNQIPNEIPSLTFIDDILGDGFKHVVLDTCNGLWLCRLGLQHLSSGWSNICVCNPTTKKYRLIPEPKSQEGWCVDGLGFAYDPSISIHYKVICVKYLIDRTRPSRVSFMVEVYSAEDHLWRFMLQLNGLEMHNFYNMDGIFWKGGTRWLGHLSFHFDLKTESLLRRKMPPLPSTIDDPPLPITFATRWGGYLFRLSGSPGNNLFVLEISEDHCSWVIKWKVNFSDLESVYPEIVRTRHSWNGEEQVSYNFGVIDVVERLNDKGGPVLVLSIPNKIIAYNFLKKKVKTLHNLPDSRGLYFNAYKFIESLSPV